MGSRSEGAWNTIVQICLPAFTILGFLLTAMKLPQYGLISGLISEIFWASASYRAWKVGQWGIALTTVVATLILTYGVINYWYL